MLSNFVKAVAGSSPPPKPAPAPGTPMPGNFTPGVSDPKMR
jgi:hypothetical protein